jgi:two-component system CheB/CheR fusion protein
VEDVREALRTLGSAEKPVAGRDGSWFTVRIMPYRTLDNRIDGVVITFADITVAKTLEAKLRERRAARERHVPRRPASRRPPATGARGSARRGSPGPDAA